MMKSSKTQARTFLKNFDLANADADTLPFYALEGFLFSVCTYPEMIYPSEWMPMVWGDKPPFKDENEANQYCSAVMTIYDSINDDVRLHKAPAARSAAFNKDPLANFEKGCPMQQWSDGVAMGEDWLSDACDSLNLEIRDKFKDEYTEIFIDRIVSSIALSHFMDQAWARKRFEEYDADETFEDYTGSIVEDFNREMEHYASFRSGLEDVITKLRAKSIELPGRNDPCPCGSGKKYKKCCGLPQKA
jgi:uncharacterized protein